MEEHFFTVIDNFEKEKLLPTNKAYLCRVNWNDWYKYETLFNLFFKNSEGKFILIGEVKISSRGLEPSENIEKGKRRVSLPSSFDQLDDEYFSLGQSEDYYELINTLPEDYKEKILKGLRDCAYDLSILKYNENEDSLHESLLRTVSINNVKNKYHRLTQGNPELTRYYFKYTLPDQNDISIEFDINPLEEPSTNVHVIIGRNGVGKTRLIHNIMKSILLKSNDFGVIDKLSFSYHKDKWDFSGVVYSSFSVFDKFSINSKEIINGIKYNRIGCLSDDVVGLNNEILSLNNEGDDSLSSKLKKEFLFSLSKCREEKRKIRYLDAISILERDPIFKEANISSFLDNEKWSNSYTNDYADKAFSLLSSGHATILLIITRLVELVDENTLVILDEPENYLHPPLLSSFIRALSNLLDSRNGVAIVATHSPVVLQEVPKDCVWQLSRAGRSVKLERPRIETFGENVGILTNEVFGLEVTNSGFHAVLSNLIDKANLEPDVDTLYNKLLDSLHYKLGAEGRSILRGLIADKLQEYEEDQ